MMMRLSSANVCGWCTLDEFIADTAEHRALHGDDADDCAWVAFDETGPVGEAVYGSWL
jgi:hypothetical protein